MRANLKLALLLLAVYTQCRVEAAAATVSETTLQKVVGPLPMFVDELPQMPKLYGFSFRHGAPVPATLTIGMFEKKWKFHRDLPPTTVFVFGTSQEAASFPGPTIEARKGIPTYVTWKNFLPRTHILPWDPTVPTAIPKTGGVPTVVHLHGGVHEPQSDGSALAWFTSGFKETGPKWSKPTYTYLNEQQAGNLWYHDHTLGLTRVNLLAGLLGAYIIRDPAHESPLNLPSGDEFDRTLVIADRSFQTDGSLYMNATGNVPSIHPQWQPEYFGHAITVNGKAWPFIRVQRRRYRFRIINSSNARYYNLSLSNGLQFAIMGSDTSYLSSPVTTTNVLLSPAEIFDLVIDFSKSAANEAILTNSAPYPYPTGTAVDSLTGSVLKFIILAGNQRVPDTSTIPARLFNYQSVATEIKIKTMRYIVFYEDTTANGQSTRLYINGKRFEDPVTETPKSGSTELWEVINLTGDNHPLHVHLGMSEAVRVQELVDVANFTDCMRKLNDATKCNISDHATGTISEVPNYEKTWKNVVKIAPGTMTSVIVTFHLVDSGNPYPFDPTAEPGYVYHCHILDHEDNAMIRPLKLLP